MNQTVAPTVLNESNSNADVTANTLRRINIFLHCMICVLGVAGNGLVINIAGLKMKRTVNTIWFLNLSVADLLFSFFLIFNVIYEYREFDWPFGQFMCVLNSLVTVLSMFASIFLLTVISVDRCLSCWVVVWARTKRTVLKARIICLFIWIVAVGCSLPLINKRKLLKISEEKTMCIPGHTDIQAFKRLAIFRFIVGFILPFAIIIASYVAIGVRVKRMQKNSKLKPFRVILAVILAFFFCWLPFHIHTFYDITLFELYTVNPSEELTHFKKVYDQIGLFIVSFAYLNSCLNPFLYVFMCEDFQKKLKKSLVAVFESAFAEEHLALLSQHSHYKHHTHSQADKGIATTQSSAFDG